MPGKKGNRPWVMMYCQELRKKKKQGAKKEIIEIEAKCNAMNYVTEKNKRNTTDKLELNKYCSLCKAKTAHIEGKNK